MSQHSQQGKHQYVVKVNFTDDSGKQWTAGSAFTGEPEVVKKALAAGKITARDAGQDQPKQPNE